MSQSKILWRDSASETLDLTPLDRNLSVDLVVIGGGFTGTAAALEAARRGARVCLLEADVIGQGGSGRNVGLVNAGLWLPHETVIDQMGEAAGRRLIEMLSDGPRRVFAIVEQEGIACEAVRAGTLHLAASRSGLRDLEERHRQGVALGAPLALLDARETARRTGTPEYHGGLLDPRAGTIQPLAYCRGLARAAIARGALIHERSPVRSVVRANGSWRAEGDLFCVKAKSLLLVTNAYQLGLGQFHQPQFTPVNYCQFATVPMPEHVRSQLLPGGEGCWDTAMVMSSFRTDRAFRMIIGGLGNTDGPGSAIHYAWARRKLRKLFPAIGNLEFEYAWRGQIAMTHDHVPKIISCGPNAYACFGYSGRGICPGTVFGTQTAVALLTENEDELPVQAIPSHSERFSGTKEAYFELGATLAHAASARRS